MSEVPSSPDLELLRIQVNWGSERSARRTWPAGLCLGVVRDGYTARLDGPDDIAELLRAALARADAPIVPDMLRRCRLVLDATCELVQLEAGPSFVFPPVLADTSPADVERSDGRVDILESLNPGNWGADEWPRLLSGDFGPWAMVVSDGRVVSICHTPRELLPNAAEAGVWTSQECRGRGFAAAATAAWADTLRPSKRHLFYSTSSGNTSSQRVAQRLGLRPIGWLWNLWCANDVVDFVRRAASPAAADRLLRLLREVTSWSDAVAQVPGERYVNLYRNVPGEVFARISPSDGEVIVRDRAGGRVASSLTEGGCADVVALLRDAYGRGLSTR